MCNRLILNKLIIWDGKLTSQTPDEALIWSPCTSATRSEHLYIAALIEEYSDTIKNRLSLYLAKYTDPSLAPFRIIETFQVLPGLSAWWLLDTTELSPYRSDIYFNLLACLALEIYLSSSSYHELELFSSNSPLVSSLAMVARDYGLVFSACRIPRRSSFNRKTSTLHLALVSLFPVKLFIKYFPKAFRNFYAQASQPLSEDISFFNYLSNLDNVRTDNNPFPAPYWGNLPALLEDLNCPSNWFHMYIRSGLTPNTKEADCIIKRFNNDSSPLFRHHLFEDFLTLNDLIVTILLWLSFAAKALYIKLVTLLQPVKTHYLDPLFIPALVRAFFSQSLINNILHTFTLHRLLASIPPQKRGYYLQEGNCWEYALNYLWRLHNHGILIGVPHVPVRYWDLRLLAISTYLPTYPAFFPKYITIHGSLAQNFFSSLRFPADRLISVEALRYSSTTTTLSAHRSTTTKAKVLLIGDFDHDSNQFMFSLFSSLPIDYLSNLEITFKPHPLTADCNQVPSLPSGILLSNKPLSTILSASAVAITCGASSSSFDCIKYSVPHIIVYNKSSLNLSPLRDSKSACFAHDCASLLSALDNTLTLPCNIQHIESLLNINPSLPRWKNHLF